MKRLFRHVSGLAVALCAAVLVAPAGWALGAEERDQTRPAEATRTERAQAGTLDDKTTGADVRASQLLGMNIQNEQGKSVGEIQDLVIDANSGRVRYAAVTYGGFLGLGNKLFAVPFEAFKCRPDPDDKDEHVLVLDVTQERLEGATGFDKDHWPNFADPGFGRDLDKRYGVERRPRKAGVDVRVGPRGVDVDVNARPKVKRDRD